MTRWTTKWQFLGWSYATDHYGSTSFGYYGYWFGRQVEFNVIKNLEPML